MRSSLRSACRHRRDVTSFVLAAADDGWIGKPLAHLAEEATRQGIRNVATLLARWEDGSERYDRLGETMLVALDSAGEKVIGVGGLTQCPHVDGAMRVRRFYVATDFRRSGVARALAEQLIVHGFDFATTLTCNAKASAAAPPFWEAMGFSRSDVAGITHLRLA
jgi:GNAT superfamily N-acetyltransferase